MRINRQSAQNSIHRSIRGLIQDSGIEGRSNRFQVIGISGPSITVRFFSQKTDFPIE
jgi:hypothetical protein